MAENVEQALLKIWHEHQRGKAAWAAQQYKTILDQHPRNANGWCYLGIALHDLKQYAKAVVAYKNAIAIQPEFPIVWNNLANSLRYVFAFEEAEKAFEKALEQNPTYANAYKNRAALRATNGQIEAALQDYRHASELQADDPELHRNLGVLLLLLGDFKAGWMEYRYRWQCKDAANEVFSAPKWKGESLAGKTILLYSEQGLGDTIHFIRYADVVKSLGARVLFKGQNELSVLLGKYPGIDHWHDSFWPVNEAYDFHCSLLDCADVLNTDLETIPARDHYLKPVPYLVKYWSEYLTKRSQGRLRIGIAWQGNANHQADQFRSVPLDTFRPLLSMEGIDFYSLQQGPATAQIVQGGLANKLHQFPEGTDSSSGAFVDTAAIMSQLDLVITTDTSIAHLAGALGCNVWVLLNVMPDWRWLLGRCDSPWYPSMKLYRQSRQGDWKPVVAAVVDEVSRLRDKVA